MRSEAVVCEGAIAVVGMAVHLPGARDVDEFWDNLRRGVESVARIEATHVPEHFRGHRKYVPAYAAAEGIDRFDAAFFGYASHEAALIDPQQRMFLECAWEALEAAGYGAVERRERVGVFGASALNVYLLRYLQSDPSVRANANLFQVLFGNDKDFLCSRVSYKLNLTGPSIAVQTACSSSLVAIQLACQSLLVHQCDTALAGGVSVHDPEREGYLHQEEGILSPDGHCRAFDAHGAGTLMASGVGMVVLKRLEDAVAARDTIHAVIRGCAVNNDGARKVGYAAPGVEGQTEAILEAQAIAGVEPETLGYVEAHGTGTLLGDPIEVAALTQAFRASTARTGFCALGSVKSNVGHLDAAAGVAGFVKAVLALSAGEIPPTLHVRDPNPELELATSPFFLNRELCAWPVAATPRRAAVSSFGIGGTNAHVVLEQAPEMARAEWARPLLLLPVSAKSHDSLERAAERLRAHVDRHSEQALADVAYTLQVGRAAFAHRLVVIAAQPSDVLDSLGPGGQVTRGIAPEHALEVVLLVGDAPAAPDLLAALREREPCISTALEECARAFAHSDAVAGERPSRELEQLRQRFAGSYALVRLWLEWLERPCALSGKGVGELVAACVAGMLTVTEAAGVLAPTYSLRGEELPKRVPRFPLWSLRTGRFFDACHAFDPSGWRCSGQQVAPSAPAELRADAVVLELNGGDGDAGAQGGAWRTLRAAIADRGEPLEDLYQTLAQLWVCGAAIDWEQVRSGERRRRVPLPTYPFDRKRHWLLPSRSERRATAPASEPATVPPVPSMPHTRERIAATVRAVVGEAARIAEAELDSSKSFFELNLDSLALMQVSSELELRLGAQVSFRQIADELSSTDLLLDHLFGLPQLATAALDSAPTRTSVNADAEQTARVEAKLEELTRELTALRRSLAPTSTVAGSGPRGGSDAGAARAVLGTATARSPESSLSGKQAAHVRRFVDRYVRRTARSREAARSSQCVLADARNTMGFRSAWKHIVYPLGLARGDGARVWDVDGNEYVDLACGFGALLFGHNPHFVRRAVEDQLAEQRVLVGAHSPLVGKVARLVAELTGMERVSFCNTGSEAVMVALRLARAKTRRSKVVAFRGSYHGNFDPVLVKPGADARNACSTPGTLGMPASLAADTCVLEYGSDEALEWLRRHGDAGAAILVEPIQRSNLALQPRRFLQELRDLADASGSALIFDEMITGFRLALGGAQEWFGVGADLATYGKIAGGGMPIGLLAGSREYLDYVDGGVWRDDDDSTPPQQQVFTGGTFTKHAFAMAAACATLETLKADAGCLQRELNRKTAGLAAELDAVFAQADVALRVVAAGSVFNLVAEPEVRNGDLLLYHLLDRGVHVAPTGSCFLSTAHQRADCDAIVEAARVSVRELRAAGFYRRAGSTSADVVPVTGLQREVWLASQLLAEASPAFHLCFTDELRGELRAEALAQAMSEVQRRHVALRMCIEDTGIEQRPLAPAQQRMTVIDVTELRDAMLETVAAEIVAALQQEPFDLAVGAPLRAALLRGVDRHLLVSVVHHVVLDGFSSGILRSELFTCYRQFTSGEPARLPRPRDFAAYARAQASRYDTPAAERALTLWQRFLAHDYAPTLPADRPRTLRRSFTGSRRSRAFAGLPLRGLRKAAAANDFTLYTVLLAAYQVLLHRVSERTEFVVGVAVLSSAASEAEPLVGLVTNLLPVWARITLDSTFLDVAMTAKAALLDAHELADFALGEFLRTGKLRREPMRVAPMRAIFNMDRADGVQESGAIEVRPLPTRTFHVFHELTWNVVDHGGDLLIDCDYDSELFTEQTIERWLSEYAEILARIANAGFQQPCSEKVPCSLAHERVRDQGARHPDRVAVEHGDERMTYAELERRATTVAAELQRRGVRTETAVAVCMQRSPAWIVALLGVLKAGACYVPLDPDYPRSRLESMLQQSRAELLLGDDDGYSELGQCGARGAFVNVSKIAAGTPATLRPPLVHPENRMYVLFTSGSTGEPKGIEIAHASFARFLDGVSERLLFGADEVVCAVNSPCFDISLFDVFVPLASGARIVLVDKEVAYDGRPLCGVLRAVQATMLQATPSLLRETLCASGERFPALRVYAGGEAMTPALAAQIKRCARALWNGYGPTEATVYFSAGEVADDGPISLGAPLRGCTATLLDETWTARADDVPRELVVAGNTARGYLDDPMLTAERFMPDAASTAGARVYRTGDLVRALHGGCIEFVGRKDRQAKIRGVRVELGEVEAVIAQQSGVEQCAVEVRTNAQGAQELVAYVALSSGQSSWVLRKRLRQRLPEAFIPAQLIEIDNLPLTANAKLDRRALARSSSARSAGSASVSTGLESDVAHIWSEELNISGVSADDHFFDLGGNSFQAVHAMRRMRRELGMQVSFHDFLFKTLAQMVAETEEAG